MLAPNTLLNGRYRIEKLIGQGVVWVWYGRGVQGSCATFAMVNWHRFTPYEFEYDFENDKLAVHSLTFEKAVECFFSDFTIRRNKSYRDRYQLIGRTVGGRRLKIIFQIKPGIEISGCAFKW